jgi:hypothetical protein
MKQNYIYINIFTIPGKGILSILDSRLLCIGVSINDKPIDVIKYDSKERIMLEQLEAYIEGNLGKDKYDIQWVGDDLIYFTLIFLHHKAKTYKLKELIKMLPEIESNQDILCMWNSRQMIGSNIFDNLEQLYESIADQVDINKRIHHKLLL